VSPTSRNSPTFTREFDEQIGGGLVQVLEQMALMSDIDTLKAGADSVVMMTLHAAKGLEFPYVFLTGHGKRTSSPLPRPG